MPTTSGPSPEQIEQWLDEVDARLAEIQVQVEPLLAEQGRLHERRILLKELLASFGDATAGVPVPARSHLSETVRERVHRQAVDVFAQVGRPLHINDLHAEFLKRGYEVPGAGKPNNITVHLGGWSDVVSPERGIYGLAEHVGEITPQQAPKRSNPGRRRKRKAR